MAFAVEMYFDTASESRLCALGNELATLGAAPVGGADHPHVSLAVCDSIDVTAARAALDVFAARHSEFPLALSSVGFFVTARVLFLAPKVTTHLLEFHQRFFASFKAFAGGIWDYYTPAQWVPHCTLAMNLPHDLLAPAVAACTSFGLPLHCTVREIGLVEFRPVREIYAVPLSGGELPR